MTKLKKHKLWQNSRIQIVTKLKKKKLWQNLKDQIVTKLKNSNCAKLNKLNCDNSKTQFVIIIKITVMTEVVITTPFSKNTLTPWQPTNSQASFSQFLRCFQGGCQWQVQPFLSSYWIHTLELMIKSKFPKDTTYNIISLLKCILCTVC